jgi:hypothetical protein
MFILKLEWILNYPHMGIYGWWNSNAMGAELGSWYEIKSCHGTPFSYFPPQNSSRTWEMNHWFPYSLNSKFQTLYHVHKFCFVFGHEFDFVCVYKGKVFYRNCHSLRSVMINLITSLPWTQPEISMCIKTMDGPYLLTKNFKCFTSLVYMH